MITPSPGGGGGMITPNPGGGGGIITPGATPIDPAIAVLKPTALVKANNAKPQTTTHLFIELSETGFPSQGVYCGLVPVNRENSGCVS